jgi:hypothetical protein
LTRSDERADTFKRKYLGVNNKDGVSLMEDARSMSHMGHGSREEDEDGAHSRGSASRQPRGAESIASLGNSMAQHARSLVGSFACSGINERTDGVLASELAEGREDGSRPRYGEKEWRDRRRSNSAPKQREQNNASLLAQSKNPNSKSFRGEYSQAPRRVDV